MTEERAAPSLLSSMSWSVATGLVIKSKRLLRQSVVVKTIGRNARAAVVRYRSDRQRRAWIAGGGASIRLYLGTHPVRKLHLGAGRAVLSGWLNTDSAGAPGLVYLDVTQRFAFDDGTFDYVFSEHLIEHLSYQDGLFMLRECLRVLKPGGRIRIATPNIEFLARLCLNGEGEIEQRYVRRTIDTARELVGPPNWCFVVNHFFRGFGHQFIYDAGTLEDALQEVGFTDIVRHSVGESDDKHLRGIESHGKFVGEEMNLLETMVFEARRPVAAVSSAAGDG